MEPPQHPQNWNGDPLHREAAIGLRYWEPTEIYGLFQSNPICFEPIVLLGTNVSKNASVPDLPRLKQGQSSAQTSMRGGAALALRQAEAGRLRDKGTQIPLALETDPLSVADEIGDLTELLMPHAAIDQPHDPCRMLALEPLVNVLGPSDRRGPQDHDRGFLRGAPPVLHADPAVQTVVIGTETQNLRDPKAEPVLPDQRHLAAARSSHEVERLRRNHEIHDTRRLSCPLHGDSKWPEQLRDDHRLGAPKLQLPRRQVATAARHLSLEQRPKDGRRLEWHRGRRNRYRCSGCSRGRRRSRQRRCCAFPHAGHLGLGGGGRSFRLVNKERLIQDEQARHQEGRDNRSLFHQSRSSIKVDAPRSHVTMRAADRTRPG